MISFTQAKFLLKHTLQRGPAFAYWYWKVRSGRILRWRNPAAGQALEPVAVHVLVGEDQLKMALWMLASFFEKTQRNWRVYVHDDGSLRSDSRLLLSRVGIEAEVIATATAAARAESALKDLPLCKKTYETCFMARKFFGPFLFGSENKYLALDSDLIFFKQPREILEWVDSPRDEMLFNKDTCDRLQVDRVEIDRNFGFEPWRQVNAGLCCIARKGICLQDTEAFLSHGDLHRKADQWMLEQTLYALHASKLNAGGLLPDTYSVTHAASRDKTCVARHYVGKVRDQFYTEGCASLSKELQKPPKQKQSIGAQTSPRKTARFSVSFREFKFCLKQTLRKGPVFLRWYLWARSPAVTGWRNPWSNLTVEKVPLHVMTGSDQFAMTKCMLVSFFEKTRRNWKVVLHDDGTLPEDAVRVLGEMGIQAEYVGRSALLDRARQVLADLPLCRRVCEETLLAPKFFGPLIFAGAPKMLLIDSDIVFFKEPREILEWVDSDSENMFFCGDLSDTAKALRAPLRDKLGVRLWESVNSGICCLCPGRFEFGDTEKFLRELDLLQTLDPWLIEQTLFAIHASASGRGGLLPSTYELSYSPACAPDCVARHYVGKVRELFYTEAVPALAESRKTAQTFPADGPRGPRR